MQQEAQRSKKGAPRPLAKLLIHHDSWAARWVFLNLMIVEQCSGYKLIGLLYGKYRRCETRSSLGPDQINEYASMVVLQVGQFVGEVGKVVADAGLQVLADVMIDCGQDAAAGVDLGPEGQAAAPRPISFRNEASRTEQGRHF